MRQLKFLPWRSLIGIAALTIIAATGLDVLLVWGLEQSIGLQQFLLNVLTPPWNLVIDVAVGFGLGALGVYLLETLMRRVPIYASTLWAFILCLVLVLWLKSSLPLPALFVVGLARNYVIGLLLGVFWKGRRYWR